MIPSWSIKAKQAVSIFFAKWNDIDIYIEDREHITVKIYIELLSRISNGKYKIERVFPLGGRENVIESCKKANTKKKTRLSLFIIDGDLDLLLGIEQPNIPRLYRHQFYCIENVLIDKEAGVEIMYEDDSRRNREEIASELNFEKRFNEEVNILLELFIVFSLMRIFSPGEISISLKITHFTTGGKTPKLDTDKITKYIDKNITDMIEKHGEETVNSIKTKIQKRIDSNTLSYNYISGKDFLLPLFDRIMRSVVKITTSKSSLKMRLAKKCDISHLKPLKETIEKISLGKI